FRWLVCGLAAVSAVAAQLVTVDLLDQGRCRSRNLENAVHPIEWYSQTVTRRSSFPHAAACDIDGGGACVLAAARLEVRQEVREKSDRRQERAKFEHEADARRVREHP